MNSSSAAHRGAGFTFGAKFAAQFLHLGSTGVHRVGSSRFRHERTRGARWRLGFTARTLRGGIFAEAEWVKLRTSSETSFTRRACFPAGAFFIRSPEKRCCSATFLCGEKRVALEHHAKVAVARFQFN